MKRNFWENDELFVNMRGSNKYLASQLDDGTTKKEIFSRLVYSRRLLSKFQPNRTSRYVLNALKTGVSADFIKLKKNNIAL